MPRLLSCVVSALSWFLVSAAPVGADQADPRPPDPIVADIEWEGLKEVSEADLELAILTTEKSWKPWVEGRPYEAGTFEQDLKRITRFFQRKGFYHTQLETEIQEKNAREVVIRIRVEEGAQATLEELDVQLDSPGASAAPLEAGELSRELALVPGTGFSSDQYEQSKVVLQERLARRGYPASKISGGAEVDLDKNVVFVRWAIDPGPLVRMGKATLIGTERVAQELVLGEVGWATGDVYDSKKIRQTQRAIFDLGLFRSVTIEPDRSGVPTEGVSDQEGGAGERIWPLVIRVRERAPRSLRASVGYGTEDQVRARLEWRHRNFLGGLRNLRVGGKYSFLVRGVETVFVQPRFITRETKLTVDAVLNDETTPAFDTRGVAAGWLVERPIVGRWRGRFGQRAEFRRVTSVSGNDALVQSDDNESFRLIYFELGARHSNLDSEHEPTRGTWFDLDLEPSFKVLGSDVSYLKGVVEFRHFIPVYQRLVLASRLRLSTIQPVLGDNTADIPVFKRLFAGGSASVRGFDFHQLGPLAPDEDPLGGLTSAEASIEARFPIWRALGGVLFVDAGQVALDAFNLRRDDFFYSTGGGLRYRTPIGPLRLDFARILNAPDGLADFRVHFSIGHAF